ncbi:hypothetical protein CRG98_047748 [Punica granatum]|uniref:Uncharacterized protein n=1 Tax=Punica granatum TaxID=22663 RepID=A0A2I0HJH9_PUNGR|nr:hypothetical protein CRG98_047748 [Punica granatum]
MDICILREGYIINSRCVSLLNGLDEVGEEDNDLGEGDAGGNVADDIEEAMAEEGKEERLGDLGQGCNFRSPNEDIAVVEVGGREAKWVGTGIVGSERRGEVGNLMGEEFGGANEEGRSGGREATCLSGKAINKKG